MTSQLEKLKGSIPPLITPFRDGEVDYEAFGPGQFQVKNGSHGILVNGTTAEPSTLTVEERNRLVDLAIQVGAKRVPVIAATGSQSLRETTVLTEHAARGWGADALLIVTPYYVRPPQRGLVAYYLQLASISDLPWMVYHIPGRTAVGVTIDTLQELRAKSSTFVGMKHAVNDLVSYRNASPPWGATSGSSSAWRS